MGGREGGGKIFQDGASKIFRTGVGFRFVCFLFLGEGDYGVIFFEGGSIPHYAMFQ